MSVIAIKRYLATKIGDNLVVVYHGTRNRRERFKGILWKIYDNVFTIKLDTGEVKSFTYIDILTKTIQIYI